MNVCTFSVFGVVVSGGHNWEQTKKSKQKKTIIFVHIPVLYTHHVVHHCHHGDEGCRSPDRHRDSSSLAGDKCNKTSLRSYLEVDKSFPFIYLDWFIYFWMCRIFNQLDFYCWELIISYSVPPPEAKQEHICRLFWWYLYCSVLILKTDLMFILQLWALSSFVWH